MLEQRDGERERHLEVAEELRRGLEAVGVLRHPGTEAARLSLEERRPPARGETVDEVQQLLRLPAVSEGQRRLDRVDDAVLHGLEMVPRTRAASIVAAPAEIASSWRPSPRRSAAVAESHVQRSWRSVECSSRANIE